MIPKFVPRMFIIFCGMFYAHVFCIYQLIMPHLREQQSNQLMAVGHQLSSGCILIKMRQSKPKSRLILLYHCCSKGGFDLPSYDAMTRLLPDHHQPPRRSNPALLRSSSAEVCARPPHSPEPERADGPSMDRVHCLHAR